MPENNDIFGTTAGVNANSALETVQSEEISRLQQQQDIPVDTPIPDNAPSDTELRQQEQLRAATARADAAEAAAQAAQARADAAAQQVPFAVARAQAQAEAAQHNAQAAQYRSYRVATAQPAWTPEIGNARAVERGAVRPMIDNSGGEPGSMLSAPGNANDFFDQADYDASGRSTGYFVGQDAPILESWQGGDYSLPGAGTVSRVNDPTAPWARTGAPSPSRPRYASAKEAKDLDTLLSTGLADEYAQAGRVPDIGGEEFTKTLNAQRVEAELIAGPKVHASIGARIFHNMAEDWAEPYGKLNYGYAISQLGQQAGQYYTATQSGQYLTPEQRETAQAGMLPGAFALAGTAIGSAIAPGVGSWVGGLVGAGVGSGVQGVIGANDERNQATREEAERLAASLGAASASATQFRTQLEATGVPIQQLAQGLSALQASGPGVGAAAIAGAGRAALAEGEFYGPDTAATSRFLASSPALAPLAQNYRTNGRLDRAQYEGIAGLAIAEGDSGEFNAAQMQASRAERTNDPVYQKEAAELAGRKSSIWYAMDRGLTGAYRQFGLLKSDDLTEQQQDLVDAQGARDDAASAAKAQQYVDQNLAINAGRQSLFDAGLQTKIGQTGYGTAAASGASAAALHQLVPGITASLNAASAADQSLIDTDTGLMNGLTDASDPTGSLRTNYRNLINSARADQAQNPLAIAELNRRDFTAPLEEREAAFGLDITQRQGGITRKLLEGRGYDALAGDENAILSSQSARANELRRAAENPLVRDTAEDNNLRAQATALDTSSLVEKHDFEQNIYRQRNAGLDQAVSAASQQTGEARAFGSPDAVYGAQSRELDTLRSKFNELTNELQRGGLTVDEARQKEAELISVRGQAVQIVAQQRDERIANNRGMAEDDLTGATAGMGHQVRVFGSAGVDTGRINSAFGGILTADQDAINAYAPGTRDRADAEARLASDQARFQEQRDQLNEYSPSAATRIGDVQGASALRRAETAFSLEQLSPYRTGDPRSNPLTAGLTVERALKADIALQDRDQAGEDAFRAQRQRQGTWDDAAEAGYLSDKERRDQSVDRDRLWFGQVEHDRNWEMLKALPLMLAGGTGTGNTVSSVSFDALSSYYSPNVREGSWVHGARPGGVGIPGSVPGNSFEGFQNHVAASSGTTLTMAIQTLAHGMNTAQLAALLTQMLSELRGLRSDSRQRIAPPGGPPRTSVGAAVQAGRQSFNANRPGLR